MKMKKFKLHTKSAIVAILLLASCATKEPVEKYCGGVIVYKGDAPVGNWFEIKYNGKITGRVYLYKLDYDKYDVGDTIKCSSADSLLYAR